MDNDRLSVRVHEPNQPDSMFKPLLCFREYGRRFITRGYNLHNQIRQEIRKAASQFVGFQAFA